MSQYVSPRSCSCASIVLRLGGGGARICTLCLRVCPAGAGRPDVRLLVSSVSGGCCLVCSEMLCEERCKPLYDETLPAELLYWGPLMELRGRAMVLELGGGISRKFPPSGVSAPEWWLPLLMRLSGRVLLMRLSGRLLLTRLSGLVLLARLIGLLKFTTGVLKFVTGVLKFATGVLKFVTGVLKFTTGGGRSVAVEEAGRGMP